MFSSTIICTVGRASLARSVRSVLGQDFSREGFEVVVVNDSGAPLPEEDWQEAPGVRVIRTGAARRGQSVARNAGAAIAQGRYFHFLDDDDQLCPGALDACWQAAQPAQAPWLYGGVPRVDREGHPAPPLAQPVGGNVLPHVMGGEWFPLQASFIRADVFFEVGGFDPSLSASEDMDLIGRVALAADMTRVGADVCLYTVGRAGSEANHALDVPCLIQAREKIFNDPRGFRRLAHQEMNAYERGSVLHAYLISVKQNARQRRWPAVASRAIDSAAVLLDAGAHLLQRPFWEGAWQPFKGAAYAATGPHAEEQTAASGISPLGGDGTHVPKTQPQQP